MDKDVTSELQKKCIKEGLKMTAVRKVIFDTLSESSDCPDVERKKASSRSLSLDHTVSRLVVCAGNVVK
ncbi:MAG TPA: hypothetical protein DD400_01905 [Rhodospirillaceae bacterium]|nr:hypothetical protein [Rhodospirillaceae bacterium]